MTDILPLWAREENFRRGNYSPADHGQRCESGELVFCEDFYKDQKTAYLYVCWTCRLFWEFLPEWLDKTDDGKQANRGAKSRLARAAEIWRRYSGQDGVLRLATVPGPHPSEEAA